MSVLIAPYCLLIALGGHLRAHRGARRAGHLAGAAIGLGILIGLQSIRVAGWVRLEFLICELLLVSVRCAPIHF